MNDPATRIDTLARQAWRYYCRHADDAQARHQLDTRTFQRLYAGKMPVAPGIAREAAARMQKWLRLGQIGPNRDRVAKAIRHLLAWADIEEARRNG